MNWCLKENLPTWAIFICVSLSIVLTPSHLLAGEREYFSTNGLYEVAQLRAPEDAKELDEKQILNEILVPAQRTAYQESISTAGTKFPVEIEKIPQGIQVINRELIKDQGMLQLGDVLKMIPSANIGTSRLSAFPSFGGNWTIRGQKMSVTRNGFRPLFFEDVDQSAMSNIERVEVIKGPGSALFGQDGLGGTMNLVTKKPQKKFSANTYGMVGTQGTRIGGFDITGPLTDNKALSARLVFEVERSDTFVDEQDIDRENLATSFAWDNGGPVRAYINAEYHERRTQRHPGLPPEGTIISNGIGDVSRDTFLGDSRFDFMDNTAPVIQAWVDIDLNEDWTLTPRFQYHEFHVAQQQFILGKALPDKVTIPRTGRFDFHEDDLGVVAQVDLKGKFDTGPLKHEMVLGVEYDYFDDEGSWFPFSSVPSVNALSPAPLSSLPPVSATQLTFSSLWNIPSVQFQDLISITPNFDILGSVKFQYVMMSSSFLAAEVDNQDSKETTYQIGGVYRFDPGVHVFAGFGTGLDIDNVLGAVSADGSLFTPETSEQIEAGVKLNLPFGMKGTASYFNLTRSNVSTDDPANPGFAIQVGEQTTQGLDLDLNWQVTDNWYVQAGYAFTDSEISEDNSGNKGNQIQDVAEHQFNFWTRYLFTQGIFRNFSMGAGVNFVGERPLDNANTIELPSYTTVDLSASYKYKNTNWELIGKNILDNEFFTRSRANAVFPGDPREILGRVTVYFE